MKGSRIFAKFTTLDIVLMAMLATLNGVMTVYLSMINKTLNSLGGPIATSAIVGLYMIYGLLAYYIIRKPGTAVIAYALGAVVQSFMGSAYGIASIIAAAVCYMVAAELVFALLRYRRWNAVSLMLVGGAMVPLWFIVAANMFGYMHWGWKVLTIALVVRILSGIVLCGLLTKVLGDALNGTGLLKRFELGRASRA
ncbi:ECF transporter S component [Paenibacillus sp. P2(2022)]|uniref:ECF transporter S component n=1 Tax=Paenibacillus sp. P2(2022) TaxID=2917813 RepID=UPI002405D85B|nr:ECF transporter S component [Paenibacillus sp. P2(2022)]MDG0056303.1 ECF transporter S component [Paenibacillus sp. P2(2022)]